MLSPFVVGRGIFFCVTLSLNIFTLISASWNIHEAVTSGLQAPGVSAFLVLNSSMVMLLSVGAYLEAFFPNPWTSFVGFECIWTLTLTVLQIVAATLTTLLGPPNMCLQIVDWALCATAVMTVPLSWLCATSLGGYTTALIMSSITHQRAYPELWWCTVSSVSWFVQRASDCSKEDGRSAGQEPLSFEDAQRRKSTHYPIVFPPLSPSLGRPGWARTIRTRPALDEPFVLQETRKSQPNASCQATRQPPFFGTQRGHQLEDAFPMEDIDLTPQPQAPVTPPRPTMPRWSEYQKSYAKKGITVHTIPVPTP